MKTILGDGGESSIRASFGTFYTAFPGLSAGIMYGVPPFGYNYLSPSPPLFAQPFINAGDGAANIDPYPFTFPAAQCFGVESGSRTYNWAAVTPDQRRSLLVLPQSDPVHRKLHVFDSAANQEQGSADGELCRQSGASSAGPDLDQSRRIRPYA